MSNRLITLGLFGLIMIVFTTYFIVQRINFPSGQPITGYFQGIIQDVNQGEWDEAKQKADQLKRLWRQRKFLVMLNYAEADYQVFEDTIGRLTAAVQTKERYQTISQAMVGEELWNNFLRVVPGP